MQFTLPLPYRLCCRTRTYPNRGRDSPTVLRFGVNPCHIGGMGWWMCNNNGVIGDAPADYLEEVIEQRSLSEPWRKASEIPADVRRHLDRIHVDGLGRRANDADIDALLSFVFQQ